MILLTPHSNRKLLQEQKPGTYSSMVLTNKLFSHLYQIQEQVKEQMELLTRQMMEKEGVDEELKAKDRMLWVQKMNNIQASAEEIVLKELIYS